MRKAVLVAAMLVLAAVAAMIGGASAGASETTSARTVRVDDVLLNRLEANPTGGVTAIVTTWNREGLDAVEAAGIRGTRLKVLPMIITSALTRAQLSALETMPEVRSVWGQREYELYMEDSTWITKARYVWSTNTSGPATHRGFNITGRGVELAVIDTGFEGKHEDGDNLIEFCQSITSSSGTRQEVLCTPWNMSFNPGPAGACGAAYPGSSNTGPGPTLVAPGCRNKARGDSADPDVSHGTHVGGTMVGTGHASGGKGFNHSTIGMAPDARLRSYKSGSAALLNTWTLAAYDDMTYKKERGYSNVIAVNNSWGGGDGANYDSSDPTAVAVKRAYDAGIVSVFAAGNSGPEHNTLSSQCVDPYVVCVAASTKPDSVVMFSSRGRPSQPTDTNRDGVVDNEDVQPDNHDRRLGQVLGLGLYRPTLTAPGVNINSMRAVAANIGDPSAAACYEDLLITARSNCYVQANGTSMATPHVTGAIGLLGQALIQRGRNIRSSTFSRDVIDILERSANTAKLPAWDSEEQGAGRLDIHQAIRYARGDISLRRPNFGYPTPPYETGQYPDATKATGAKDGPTDRFYSEEGCSGTGSWTAREIAMPLNPPIGIGQPPGVAPQRYGQHFIDVPPNTDRIRVTVQWNSDDNFYVRIWRPGVNPDAESATPDAGPQPGFPGRPSGYHQSRVFPDQEALGLLEGNIPFLGPHRLLEVRTPEESNVGPRTRTPVPGEGDAPPAIPSGQWVVRVYHRAGTPGSTAECAGTQENPKQPEGNRYEMKVELPGVTYRPSVKIDSTLGAVQTNRFVEMRGRAGYPPHTQQAAGTAEPTAPPLGNVGYSWEGITNWEAPGSARGAATDENADPDPSNPRPVLYMHGNTEEGCVGNGEADVAGCNGPFLLGKAPDGPKPAVWRTGIDDEVFDGTSDRSIHDPNWSWCLAAGPGCPIVAQTDVPAGPQTVGGPMTVEWWAQCNLCGGIFSADWIIRVWGDGVLRFEQRVTATPPALGLPGRLVRTVTIPTFTANQRIVVHIDPVYVDSQTVTNVYYDSAGPGDCTAVAGRCDSLVRMPVGSTGGAAGGSAATVENVRVTDLPANPAENHAYPANRPLSPALRVAWDAQAPAPTRYEVFRSTDPTLQGTRVYSGPGVGCISPQAPTPNQPPGHDRAGLCYTDTGVSLLTTYYYRVFAVRGTARSTTSEVAYGAPTRYDRQVKLKVDRLYGTQYWEYALLPPSPNPVDTTNAGTQWLYNWDTLELVDGTYAFPGTALVPGAHLLFARSFTQGIGSTKDGKAATLDDNGGGEPGPGPGCPDDDDGDGDDDEEDGDDDDNGDDEDDDCEDDDDHEEDEDD